MTLYPIQSEALTPLEHAFFSRKGGVSEGLYHGLNGGVGSADLPVAVAENRRRISAYLGGAPVQSVHQVHSADVVVVDQPLAERPRADAMVTRTPGIALAVLTADCTPVLFADREGGVIGAAHAGWKGALGGVLEATVDAMTAQGAARERITAVAGPVISQRAYEVGPEFVERFIDDDPAYSRFFASGAGDRAMFDLPGFCLHRLRRAEIGNALWTGHCTYSDEDNFYSYRRSCHRDEPDYGRLVSAIRL